MNRRAAASLTVRAALVAVALVACQVVAGIDRVEKVDPGSSTPDASDGDAKLDSGPSDPCSHALPPPQPDNDDDRDAELPPFYLALRTLDVIAKEGSLYRGFDLDGACTCDDRPGTAFGGEASCTPKVRQCDQDGGIDNKGAALFEKFAPTGYSPNEVANRGIAQGRRGLLLYIKNYNGKKNDRQVSVGLLVTHGIIDGSGCGTTSGQVHSPPGWCGNDLWTFPVGQVKPTTKEPLFQGNGYVNDGVLVFRSDEETTVLFGGTLLPFGSPMMAARLGQNQDGHWTLDGLLGGRLPVTDLLAAVGTINDPQGGGNGLCNNAALFGTVKKELCDAVDINKSNAFDFKQGACDGVSTAIAFTAEQASVGEERTEPPESHPCDKANVPPDLYTCTP